MLDSYKLTDFQKLTITLVKKIPKRIQISYSPYYALKTMTASNNLVRDKEYKLQNNNLSRLQPLYLKRSNAYSNNLAQHHFAP